jgi:predicted outer membrane repeat protein
MRLLVVPLSMLVITATAGAAEINVPADYASIQAAINAASNGDEILVAPGNYVGVSFSDLSITIRATGSAAETIVEGGPGGWECGVITCYGQGLDDVVIDGFTITGGECEGDYDQGGGGIWCGWLRDLTIKNCVISNNSSVWMGEGGGLWLAQIYGSASIMDCTFSNNTANNYDGGHGGGIYCSSSSPTITNCIFSSNSADTGGDIYIYGGASISNCDFCGNGNNSIHGSYSGSGNTFLDECPQSCPDINADGHVGISDLLVVLQFWGGDDPDADINEDGVVNMIDLSAILDGWGPCA